MTIRLKRFPLRLNREYKLFGITSLFCIAMFGVNLGFGYISQLLGNSDLATLNYGITPIWFILAFVSGACIPFCLERRK